MRSQKPHLPGLAREVVAFVHAVERARYEEELDDLDAELAHREHNFLRVLWGAIVENFRLARLARARGIVGDIEWACRTDVINRSCRTISQLAGETGYLTVPPEFTPVNNWSSQVAKELASAIRNAFRSTRHDALRHLAHFLPRYVIDLVRRNIVPVTVTTVIFGWAITAFIDWRHIGKWTLVGLILVGVSKFGPTVYKKYNKAKWLEQHRTAVEKGARNLYRAFQAFLPERAFLDAMQKMTDPTKRRELAPDAPPEP